MGRIPCKKCLLSEIDPGEEWEKIQQLLRLMPQKEKTSDEEYEKRLDQCRNCDQLTDGTCCACGCYVELRAAKISTHCPKKRW